MRPVPLSSPEMGEMGGTVSGGVRTGRVAVLALTRVILVR